MNEWVNLWLFCKESFKIKEVCFAHAATLHCSQAARATLRGLNTVWKSYGHISCECPFHTVHFPPPLCLICGRLTIAAHHFAQPHPPAPVGPNLRRFSMPNGTWNVLHLPQEPLSFYLTVLFETKRWPPGYIGDACAYRSHGCSRSISANSSGNRKLSWSGARRGIKACSRRSCFFFTCACHCRSSDFIPQVSWSVSWMSD